MDVLPQFVVNGIVTGLFYALIAIGLTMIFGLMDVVNFAHGEFFVLGGALTYGVVAGLGIGYIPAVFIVFCAMVVFGWAFDRLLLNPIRSSGPLSTTLVTIGATIFLGNTILLGFGSEPKTITSGFSPRPFILSDVVLTQARIFAALAAILAITACHLTLKYTRTGKALRATFQNAVAARLSGIEVDRIYSWTFGFGAAMAALAGSLLGAIFVVHTSNADLVTLKAFCVVILGGMGSFGGAVLGGLILGIVESLWGGYVSVGYMDAIGFVLIIMVLLFRPSGLMGRA